MNPGAVNSEIWRNESNCMSCILIPIKKFIFLNCEHGSSTTIDACIQSLTDLFYESDYVYLTPYWVPYDWSLFDLIGFWFGSLKAKSSSNSYNESFSTDLWDFTMKHLKEKINLP